MDIEENLESKTIKFAAVVTVKLVESPDLAVRPLVEAISTKCTSKLMLSNVKSTFFLARSYTCVRAR